MRLYSISNELELCLQYFRFNIVNIYVNLHIGEDVVFEKNREKKLVQAAQCGDLAAFEKIYSDLFPGLYGYIRARTTNTQDAEDIVSDVVFTIIRKLGNFHWQHNGSFSAWVFRIARNKLTDYYRKDGDVTVDIDDIALADLSQAPEQLVLQKNEKVLLSRQIRKLSPRKQEVLALRYFGGLRNKEIALILDVDERTVSSYLKRALTEMQNEMESDSGERRLSGEQDYDTSLYT